MIDVLNLKAIRELANLSQEELAKLYRIPTEILNKWEENSDETPEYIAPILLSALCNDGYIDNPPVILSDTRYMPTGFSSKIINPIEWKDENPKRVGLIKNLDCGQHAILIERSYGTKGLSRLERQKEMLDDPSVTII